MVDLLCKHEARSIRSCDLSAHLAAGGNSEERQSGQSGMHGVEKMKNMNQVA